MKKMQPPIPWKKIINGTLNPEDLVLLLQHAPIFRKMASQQLLSYAVRNGYYRKALFLHGDAAIKEELAQILLKTRFISKQQLVTVLCDIIRYVEGSREEAYRQLHDISDDELLRWLTRGHKDLLKGPAALLIDPLAAQTKPKMPGGFHQAKMSDEELLLASSSQPQLFQTLVQRYHQRLFQAANKIVRNPADAEDVLQEAFLRMHLFRHRFQKLEGIAFRSWAYKVTINLAKTRYRQKVRDVAPLYLPLEGMDGKDAVLEWRFRESDADKTRDIRRRIDSVLNKMPRRERTLIVQHYLQDMPYEKLIEMQGITMPTLKMRLFRARKHFKKLWEDNDDVRK